MLILFPLKEGSHQFSDKGQQHEMGKRNLYLLGRRNTHKETILNKSPHSTRLAILLHHYQRTMSDLEQIDRCLIFNA